MSDTLNQQNGGNAPQVGTSNYQSILSKNGQQPRNIYRGGNDDSTWGWYRLIDSGNIGSQSVNYATSAGTSTDCSKLNGLTIMKITRAAYNALETKDPNTLYVISD